MLDRDGHVADVHGSTLCECTLRGQSFGCLMRRLLRRHLATLSARPAEEIINLSAYPLNSLGSRVGRALLSSVGQQLHETGCAVLPNFLLPDALAEGVAECERGRARGDVFAETRFHNVYMSADDPKLPADHPIHSFQSVPKATLHMTSSSKARFSRRCMRTIPSPSSSVKQRRKPLSFRRSYSVRPHFGHGARSRVPVAFR